MQRILIIGAGFMGSGIAQVCAQSGFSVHLADTKHETLDNALSGIKWTLEKLFSKQIIKESPETVLARITLEADFNAVTDVDLVIECVFEVESLKREIFQEIDKLAPEKTVLATNTSSIPISRIAQATKRPERVLGLHFFGPVPLMKLVEVVSGEKTSPEVFEKGVSFVHSLGKTPVRVRREIPGFVMNRIFSAAFREAVDLVAQGVASPEDVDAGMRLGYGWNAGPFEIADNAGLDTFLLIGMAMKDMGVEDLIPRSDLIERMVREGRLGRKAGKGFYRYTPEGRRIPFGNEG